MLLFDIHEHETIQSIGKWNIWTFQASCHHLLAAQVKRRPRTAFLL